MRFLVIGASGLIGSNIAAQVIDQGFDVFGTYHTRKTAKDVPGERLDIRDNTALKKLFESVEPDVVCNCVAVTDIGDCETNPQRAQSINAEAPRDIAQLCAREDIPLIHFSTGYVFDGMAEGPYTETAETNPLQEYGRSKLAGELAVQEVHPAPIICRLSCLWGVHKVTGDLVGLPAHVLSGLEAERHISITSDSYVSPIRARNVAVSALELLSDEAIGTFHIACRSCVTPFSFGEILTEEVGGHRGLLHRSPRGDKEYPAPRPRFTCLDVSKLEDYLDRRQPTLQDELRSLDSF
jgi:dTDP-4-dehydrorhamnose reductase